MKEQLDMAFAERERALRRRWNIAAKAVATVALSALYVYLDAAGREPSAIWGGFILFMVWSSGED